MERDEALEAINRLVEIMKTLPDGIREVLRSGPGTGGRSPVASFSRDATGGLIEKFTGLTPGLRSATSELMKFVGALASSAKTAKIARELATTSPLGNRGLEKIRKAIDNPFVRESEHKSVLKEVNRAERLNNRVEAYKDTSKEERAKFTEQKRLYKEAAARGDKIETARERLDKNAARAFKARDSIDSEIARVTATPASATRTAHLDDLQKRRDRATDLAKSLLRKRRNLAPDQAQATDDESKAYHAARAAAAAARAAGAASRTGSTAARAATSRAGSAAASVMASAASRSGMVALGVGVGSAVIGLGHLVAALHKTMNAMGAFAEGVNNGNRRLAAFSSQAQAAFNRLEVGGLNRTLALAEGTGFSSARLADAINKMRDQELQGNIASRNIQNTFASLGARVSGGYSAEVGKLTAQVDRLLQGSGIGNQGDAAEGLGRAFGTALTGFFTFTLEKFGDMVGLARAQDGPINPNKNPGGPGDQFAIEMARRTDGGPIRKNAWKRPKDGGI